MEREKFMKEFFKSAKKGSFETFDTYIHQDLTKAFDRGQLFLGIDDEITAHQPLVFAFPEFLFKDIDSKVIYSEDKMRYDMTRFNSLSFGDQFLYFYTCIIDHTQERMYNDFSVEVSYLDIKGLQTSFRFKKIHDIYHHILELKVLLHGKDISIPIRNRVVSVDTDEAAYQLDADVLGVLTELKKFLRSKMSF